MEEITIHLTRDGKLPRYIECPNCGDPMRRLFTRKKPTYRCSCGAETVLYPSKTQPQA